MMTSVLENILSERILFDDFKVWLVSEENCSEQADFIPCFLNYVKEKCAWLISKDGKSLESPSPKSTSQDEKQSERTSIGVKNSSDFQEKSKSPDKHKEANTNFFHGNKQNRFHEDNRVKFNTFVAKERSNTGNSEKNFHKSARKSLNFHSVENKRPEHLNSRNGQTFGENINSIEAFPPLNGSSSSGLKHNQRMPRRITPTPVQAINKGSSKFGTSRFPLPAEKVTNEVFKRTPFVETPSSNLQDEREMLRMTRNKLPQSITMLSTNDNKAEGTFSPTKSVTLNYIKPDPEKVTHKKLLETFSSVYHVLMANGLVSNVTSELYFIFEILTSKALSEEKSDGNTNIFCTIHNCIFFGVTVLSKLQHMLHLLDKNTLFSLCEIPFLSRFSPELINVLQDHCKEKQEIAAKSLPLNRVPFLLDEDSRENFIDGHSFTNFRKQRDLFCELLRDWQQQPLGSTDLKFKEIFSRKAKLLINLGPSTVNLHHLARLFQNQLIASCLGFEVNEVYDDLLSDIQRNFPVKFEKLRQRFMTPFCVGEPNPRPTFYGIQAFFSELIQAASSVTLNQHLQDIFVSKILDLNNVNILSDGESSSLNMVKEQFVFLLHTLRLLGKFLGHLYFLPYKMSEPLPASIISSQLVSRQNSVPPLDILQLLKRAIKNNQVILTVPWIIEYLSMIDPVNKNLSYVEETLQILVVIYRGKYIFSSNSLNFWFMRIIIGWLFDVLCYPTKYSFLLQPITIERNMKCKGLDSLAVIDKQLVHSCCPYLIEFRVLIHSYLNGIKNKTREIRKITPLSTAKPHVTISQTKQQTEMQLEENFFFLHPPSLKKTVEFLSERTASKIINKIRTEVTEFKLHCVKHVTSQEKYKSLVVDAKSNATKLKSYVESCIVELYEKSQSKIAHFIHTKCLEDIEHIMPYLVSDDIQPPVMKMCCQITHRLAVDKIVDWCDINLNLIDIIGDIKNKLNHLSKGEGDGDKESNLVLSRTISLLRELVLTIHSFPWSSVENKMCVLSEAKSLVTKEIGITAKRLLVGLTIDLYIALLVHYPLKCDEDLNRMFIEIWSIGKNICDLETSFIGVQNVKYFLIAKDFDASCAKFMCIFEELLKTGVFKRNRLGDYLTKLKSLQWKDSRVDAVLHCISNALKPVDSKSK